MPLSGLARKGTWSLSRQPWQKALKSTAWFIPKRTAARRCTGRPCAEGWRQWRLWFGLVRRSTRLFECIAIDARRRCRQTADREARSADGARRRQPDRHALGRRQEPGGGVRGAGWPGGVGGGARRGGIHPTALRRLLGRARHGGRAAGLRGRQGRRRPVRGHAAAQRGVHGAPRRGGKAAGAGSEPRPPQPRRPHAPGGGPVVQPDPRGAGASGPAGATGPAAPPRRRDCRRLRGRH